MPQAKCSRCQQWIFSNETIAVEHGQVFHADCRRPQALTYEEHALLYRYCWEHRLPSAQTVRGDFARRSLHQTFSGTRVISARTATRI